ncbi:hypothetical protein CcrMagneto_gp025 [Caulobacter virus Magneto]|uniref:hypothetical protein n=1 Tax=Caulobacter virus Magneto TaxID=1211642 RepID=UPI00028B27D8|nr:hypothetical protein CcrMagneto_gp025 [Caulobacter virus Magneto]AFU87195.1 hypothetical protein CcrMagneto_gp025 [Caulobacter virus Magneto]
MSVNYYIEQKGRYPQIVDWVKEDHIGQWADGRFLFCGTKHRTTREWRDRLRKLYANERIVSENGVVMSPSEFWNMVGQTLANDTTLDYALNVAQGFEQYSLARGFLEGRFWMDGPFAFTSNEFH